MKESLRRHMLQYLFISAKQLRRGVFDWHKISVTMIQLVLQQ